MKAIYSLSLLLLAIDFKPFYIGDVNPFEFFALAGFMGITKVKLSRIELLLVISWILVPMLYLMLFEGDLNIIKWGFRRSGKVLGIIFLFKLVDHHSFTKFLKIGVLITMIASSLQFFLDYDVYFLTKSGYTRASSLFGEPKGLSLFCVGAFVFLKNDWRYVFVLLIQFLMAMSPTGFIGLIVITLFYYREMGIRWNNHRPYIVVVSIALIAVLFFDRFSERMGGKNEYKRYVSINLLGSNILVEQNEQPMLTLMKESGFLNVIGAGETVSGRAYKEISRSNPLYTYVSANKFIAVTPNFALLESVASYGIVGFFIIYIRRKTFSKMHAYALLSFFVKAVYLPAFILFIKYDRISNN